MAEPAAPEAGGSLWDLNKRAEGLDPDTELPTTLDSRRVHTDGLLHCGKCGGVWFTGTIAFAADGTPARILTPQLCVGCDELRKANWPR